MSRLLMLGGETGTIATSPEAPVSITNTGGGSVAQDSNASHARSGVSTIRFASGTSGTAFITLSAAPAVPASTAMYVRAYICSFGPGVLPTTSASIVQLVGVISVKLTSGGTFQLWNDSGTPAQIGSDSAVIVDSAPNYYRVELMLTTNSSTQVTTTELRVDGVTVASASGLTIAATPAALNLGWCTAPGGTSKGLGADDVAVNNGSGAVNNSWCGPGNVVLLIPTADSSVGTGWTNDASTTSNLFDAVNGVTGTNLPQGIADTTASTGLHQIRNATSNANVNYDATMTTYTDAGIPAGATINAIIPWTVTGAPVVTSAKAGTVGVVSNPAIASVALGAGGTAGAFWSGVAAGTYSVGWKWSHGTLTETPTVTLGTAPVMRITQVTASTRIAMVCFMGIYVDYTPAAAAAAGIPDVGMALTVT